MTEATGKSPNGAAAASPVAEQPDAPHRGVLLLARGLKKSYARRTVVKGVDILVRPGEVVGLLGRNGAGKTTTFRMIVGLVRPLEGAVFFKSADISALPMFKRARLGIGYLPQEPSVFRDMSVKDNLLAAAEAMGAPQDKALSLLAEFRLAHLERSPAGVLSGGERRRLEVARTLLSSPSILLFDEPFAGIDPITVNDLQEVIFDLRSRGIAVLLTDHNVRETLAITDRAYVMEEGSIWLEGAPEELAASEKARSLYLGHNFSLDQALRQRVLHGRA
ncbi:MAG TPA: LPS export ABC transporter ATP-binding protein [Planctomycetes bacterium]|nr:LPS export ABC transporter ATP-binding protein [Planctomycetota bacterium]